MADEEGNVGIMDFNENGPIPWGLGEYSLNELVIGDGEEDESELKIELTEDQIFELLGEPFPKDKIKWSFCIIQIDTVRTKEFLELVKCDDEFIERCISKELGLYDICAYQHVTDNNEIIPDSLLDIIINRGMILKVYDSLVRLETSDQMTEGDRIVYTKSFDTLPYYVYKQPYWPSRRQTLLAEPKHPVKLNQLPAELQKKTLKIPVKFKDTKSLQIAEWYPTIDNVSELATAYGSGYSLLPVQDGVEAYCLSSPLATSDKFSEELNRSIRNLEWFAFCAYPTVLAFHSPAWKKDYHLTYDYSDITLKSLHIPYMSFESLYRGKSTYISDEERQQIVQSSPLKEVFKQNVSLFEYALHRFKPNLVIVDDSEIDVISSAYAAENHILVTPNYQGSLYVLSEVEANREKLAELAKRPYRGDYYPLVISIEKMKEINPNLNEGTDD
jgi:hypothetical protein